MTYSPFLIWFVCSSVHEMFSKLYWGAVNFMKINAFLFILLTVSDFGEVYCNRSEHSVRHLWLHKNCGSKCYTFLWASMKWHIHGYYVMIHILCSLMLSEKPYQWPARISSSPNVSCRHSYYSFLWDSMWKTCHCEQLDELTVGFVAWLALDLWKVCNFYCGI